MSFFENEDQIVPLWKAQATERSKITSDVMEYWSGLRVGGALPQQMDLDPRGIASALPYVFMLERIAPGIARIKVAGAHMNDLMGMEVKSMPITAFAAPGERSVFLPLIDQVFDGPAMVELGLEAKRAGYAPKEAEMLILPVEDGYGRVTRALGCLVARGPIVFSPYRFRVKSQRVMPLPLPVSRPEDWQDAAPVSPPVSVVPPVSRRSKPEEYRAFEDAQPKPAGFKQTKVSYLHVVESSDGA